MPRPRERVCLEDGLKLDLNRLARRGFVHPGARIGPVGITWTSSYTGEHIASGYIWANMRNEEEGLFRIALGSSPEQGILLEACHRRYGGRQWYFRCPASNRRVSVLWRPPGAHRFLSRQAWGRQVAYASQFNTTSDRAWRGQAKIKARLIGDLDPDEWDLPPKPKWMRWSTYNRYEDKFDHYEGVLDMECAIAAARLLWRWG